MVALFFKFFFVMTEIVRLGVKTVSLLAELDLSMVDYRA